MAKEKILFIDTGPIITLVMARLIWILPKLKEKYGGKFYITPAVKRELISRPMTVKRFEFEALQAMKLIRDGVLEIYDKVPKGKTDELSKLANTTFKIKGKTMDVIQSGELESLACALEIKADAIVMDERTIRLFIESNKEMKKLLEIRFKKKVDVDTAKLKNFSQKVKEVKVIRSIDLIGVAYKMGILDDYIPKQKNGRDMLVDSVLWAAKFNGCAVNGHEIDEIKNYLLKGK